MQGVEIVFESENIRYIKLSRSLINQYLKMYNDMRIQTLLFNEEFSPEEIALWITSQIENKNINAYSMVEKNTNEYIGDYEIIINDNIAEIIICITPDKQHKHYGTESLKAMIKYIYECFKVDEFQLYVKSKNTYAIECYKNVGFRKTSVIDDTICMSYKVKMKHKLYEKNNILI